MTAFNVIYFPYHVHSDWTHSKPPFWKSFILSAKQQARKFVNFADCSVESLLPVDEERKASRSGPHTKMNVTCR
jgi:hypothetical protein